MNRSNEITECPKCHSKAYCKNGKNYGKQRYKCKICSYNFTINKIGHGIDSYYVRLCLRLYLEGFGFRSIERIVGVSHVTVINWVKKYGKDIKTLHLNEKKHIKAVEVDELWSYVGLKKNFIWIWVALDREGKRVLGFTVGDRSEMTGEKLCLNLRKMQIETFYTDYWKAYENLLPCRRHIQSKAETYTIEGLNSLIRHYLARFKR